MVTTRRYDSPLRRERAAQTRDRIVAAGAQVVHELSTWDWRLVTIRAVAERAGVHERTVYRHFPTEQDLRAAILQQLYEEAGVDLDGLTLDGMRDHVAEVFRYFTSFANSTEPRADPTLVAFDTRRKQALLHAVADAAAGWNETEVRMVAALIDVLWGVPTYRRLMGAWGLDSDQTTSAVDWLLEMVVTAIRENRRPDLP